MVPTRRLGHRCFPAITDPQATAAPGHRLPAPPLRRPVPCRDPGEEVGAKTSEWPRAQPRGPPAPFLPCRLSLQAPSLSWGALPVHSRPQLLTKSDQNFSGASDRSPLKTA